MRLFEEAARAGDAESAFQLAEMYRRGGALGDPDKSTPLYAQAAGLRHAKAALRLASLAKDADGAAPHLK